MIEVGRESAFAFDIRVREDLVATSGESLVAAPNLRLRAVLIDALRRRIASWEISQEAAATRLGMDRPRLNRILQGRSERISLEALLCFAIAAGLGFEFRVQEQTASGGPHPSDTNPSIGNKENAASV